MKKIFKDIVLFFSVILIISGCSKAGVIEKTGPDFELRDYSQGYVTSKNISVNAWKPSQKCVQKASELLAKMTLAEKAGQMTQVAIRYLDNKKDLSKYSIGSVLAGGTDFPGSDLSAQSWANYIDALKEETILSRLGIPLIFGIDAVHGNAKSVGAVVFPHNIGLGCTGDLDLVRQVGQITAKETLGSGVDWTFSPVLSAVRDDRWGRTYEAFGETPQLAAEYGLAVVLGLQGETPFGPDSVIATAKHFAGDGATVFGTSPMGNAFLDRGDANMDYDLFFDLAIQQYIPSIEAGVGTIMISYSSYKNEKLHGSKRLITDVLKKQLGFNGFVVSDWKGIDEISNNFDKNVAISVNAGIDMFMLPDRYRLFIQAIQRLVPSQIPEERIDDAVRRILQIKCEYGLFEEDYSPITPPELIEKVGSSEHREVARQAVAKSMVLLKNENKILPLSKDMPIHVTGSAADNLDKQCGGWTVTWMGEGSRTSGTTLQQAILQKAKEGKVSHDSNAENIPENTSVVIVAVGEKPYAEWYGDSEELYLSKEDKEIIERVKKSQVPFVIVLFSGRPMIITEEIEAASAVVAAWLPGTEGLGMADILFGDEKPTGKLSFSWPRSMEQVPINFGDPHYDPLFPLGYGLTY